MVRVRRSYGGRFLLTALMSSRRAGHAGERDTFWSTTGSFPQEFVLKLGGETNLSTIGVSTTNGASFLSLL